MGKTHNALYLKLKMLLVWVYVKLSVVLWVISKLLNAVGVAYQKLGRIAFPCFDDVFYLQPVCWEHSYQCPWHGAECWRSGPCALSLQTFSSPPSLLWTCLQANSFWRCFLFPVGLKGGEEIMAWAELKVSMQHFIFKINFTSHIK